MTKYMAWPRPRHFYNPKVNLEELSWMSNPAKSGYELDTKKPGPPSFGIKAGAL